MPTLRLIKPAEESVGVRAQLLMLLEDMPEVLLEEVKTENCGYSMLLSQQYLWDSYLDSAYGGGVGNLAGLPQWHPVFLALGATLEICAAAYRQFCQRYKPKPKPEKRNHWGSKLLAQIKARSRLKKKGAPGQKSLWDNWTTPTEDIRQVAKKFVLANCFNPDIARLKFEPL